MVVVERMDDNAEQKYRRREPAQVFDIVLAVRTTCCHSSYSKWIEREWISKSAASLRSRKQKFVTRRSLQTTLQDAAQQAIGMGVQQIFTRNLDKFLEDQICFSNQRWTGKTF